MTRAGIIPALLLVCAGGCLAQSQPDPPSPYNNFWYWAIVVGFVVYLVWVILYGRTEKQVPPGPDLPPLSDNYGDAKFAPQQTAMAGGLSEFSGVFFGKSSSQELTLAEASANPGALVCSVPKTHALIVCPTRGGKGIKVVIPTLLRYSPSGSSVCVIDPKGENAAVTARARSAGSRIQIINPWGVMAGTFASFGFSTATYNPLDLLDRNDPNVTSIARSLATAICPLEGGKDDFWKGSAGDLLSAVFLYLAYWPGEQKTLARARQATSMNRKRFTKEFLSKMVSVGEFDGAIRNTADQFIDLADDTYSGILANLNRCMSFLNDQQVKASTASSSFSMSELTGWGVDRPTSLYIVAPTAKLATQKTWLRLLITAAVTAFKTKPEGQGGYRCMFLLDEFGNLGALDEMPADISEASSHGIDFTLILQTLDQLKATYGDNRATILNNCAYKWFSNVGDIETAEYISKTLGKKTVRTVSKGESEGQTVGGKSPQEREGKSTTYGETGRDLLTPDEVLNLGKDVAILLASGSRPQYLRPVEYWLLPDAFSMFRKSCPRLFWEPPLGYDRNPTSR